MENIKSEIKEIYLISANSEKIFGTSISLDKNLDEEIILIIDFKKYSSFDSESVPIRSLVSGFSILHLEKNKRDMTAKRGLQLTFSKQRRLEKYYDRK